MRKLKNLKLLTVFFLLIGSNSFAGNPRIDSATWKDINIDGYIDQVVLYFDSIVNISDTGLVDGFENFEIRNGTTLISIDPGDYSDPDTNVLALNFQGDSIRGTGIVGLTVKYKRTGGSSVKDVGSGLEIINGATPGLYRDSAKPVVFEAYYRDGYYDGGADSLSPDNKLDNVLMVYSEGIAEYAYAQGEFSVVSGGSIQLATGGAAQWSIVGTLSETNKIRWTLDPNSTEDTTLSSETLVQVRYGPEQKIGDGAGNYWAEDHDTTITIMDGAAPFIDTVKFIPGDGDTLGVGANLTVRVRAVGIDSVNLSADVFNVNGVDVSGTFASVGGGYYEATYTVSAVDNEIDDGTEKLPVEIVLSDTAGNACNTYRNSYISNTPGIDITKPVINSVSIPDNSFKINDVVTVTIQVNNDGGDKPALTSGTIGGYPLINFDSTLNDTYYAEFVVTSNGNNYPAAADIPVSNLVLTDNAGNSSDVYAGYITQNNDAIDSKAPVITNVSIPDQPILVGDDVDVTITVKSDGGDFPSLISGTVAGYDLKNLAKTNNTTYKAIFSVGDSSTDFAAGDTLFVENLILQDTAGNQSGVFLDTIVQSNDLIDANLPTIDTVFIGDTAMTVGEDVFAVIQVRDDQGDFPSLVSGSIAGFELTDLTGISNTQYTAKFHISEGGTNYAGKDTIPVTNLVLKDPAGNESDPYTDVIIQSNDTIDANSPYIQDVNIPNDTMIVNDTVVATITVNPDGGETLILDTGAIAGFPLQGFTRLNSTNYSAYFVVTNGGTDYAGSANIPVTELRLYDSLGNVSNTYTDPIIQSKDLLDANKPNITGFKAPDQAFIISDMAVDTIYVVDDNNDFPNLISGKYGGYTLTNLAKINNTTYTVEFTVVEGGNSYNSGDDIQLQNLKLRDNAGNSSNIYSTAVSQLNDPIYATKPTASISGTAEICEDDSTQISVELTGSPPWDLTIEEGGDVANFTGIATSPFTFYTDTAGTYTVTAVDDQTGNTGTIINASVTITVNTLPPVSFNMDPTYNVNDTAFQITTGNPRGGTYSGPGITSIDSTFHPNIAGVDNSPHVIRYTYTDANGCTNYYEDTVSVVEEAAYFTSLEAYYCVDGSTDQVVVRNLPVGADSISFSLAGGVGLDTVGMDDTTAMLDPSLIGYGRDTITFRYYDAAWFSISRSFQVDSIGESIDFVTLDSAYCAGDDDVILNAINLFPSGGTGNFSGTAFATSQDANTITFSPQSLTPDSTYTVKYYYRNPTSGCRSPDIIKNVTVNDLPEVSFTLKSNYNVDGGEVPLVGNYPGYGTFSGRGVSNNILYPGVVNVASDVEIVYTYTDTVTGCVNSTRDTTDIREATVNILGLQDFMCYDSTAVLGVGIEKEPNRNYSDGQFFGEGIDSIDVDTATFTMNKVGRGYDTVIYRYFDDSTLYEVSQVVYVDSIGEVNFSGLSAEYCAGAPIINLTASYDHPDGQGNFTFSGSAKGGFSNFGNTASLDPSANLADSLPYDMTYTYTSDFLSTCKSTKTKQVYIHPLPDVSFSLKSNYNLEGSSVPLTGTPDGGEFEGPGILDNELFPDLVGSVATINVKYTYTDSLTGCANDTTISTDIRKADVSILGLESTYCYDSIRDTITVDKYTYTNGHFLGRGIDSIGSDSIVFNPVLAGNGYDTIIYRYYDDSTLYEVSRVTRVDSLGPPVISNLKDAYCAGDPLANINGTLIHPNGFGTFTFSDPTPLFVNQGNSATLDPDASLADSLPYTVTYTYESLISGCQRSISKNTLIHPLPQVVFALLSNYNVETEKVDLNGIPDGGSFNGPGVFQDEFGDYFFSPSQAKAGDNYNITYTYTDANSCSNDTTRITNVSAVDARFHSIEPGNNYCIDGGVDTIAASADNSNGNPGVFTGNGIIDLGNDTALFDPALAGKGDHAITYSYTGDDNVTQYNIQELLSVDSIGEVRIIGLNSAYCEDANQFVIESSYNHPDGSGQFYGPSNGFFPSGEEAIINPDSVGARDSAYTVTYVYTASSGCISQTSKEFFIHPLPGLSFAIKDLYNNTEEADTLQGIPTGGYFSGKGIVNDSIFRPDIAGVGNWPIDYQYTDTNGCSNLERYTVEVQQSSGSINYRETDNIYCYYSEVDTLIALPGNSNGERGWFEGKGITETGKDTALFDPVAAGDGVHDIRYYYYGFDSVTVFSLDLTLTVDSIGNVDFTGLDDAYCEDVTQVTLTPQYPSGGTGQFITQTGVYNSGDIGFLRPVEMVSDTLYQITYLYTSTLSGCQKQVTKPVYINSLPNVSFDVLDVYNKESDPVLFTGNPMGSSGLFEPLSLMSNNGDGTAYFNPENAGVGNHSISYSYTDTNGCTNQIQHQVEVQEASGELTVNDADNIYCYDADPDTVYANPLNSDGTPGVFTGKGITNLGNNKALFDPAEAGNGDHFITFEYNGSGGVTIFALEKKLSVDSIGKVNFIGLSPHFCANDPQVQLTPINSPDNGTEAFFGEGVLGDIYIPGNASVGYDTVSYVFTRTRSQCVARKDSVVEIHAIPDVGFKITDECIAEEDDSTEFINHTGSIDPVVAWEWNFGDVLSGQLNNSSEKNPFHLYTSPGEKTVTLKAVTDFGCELTHDSTISLGTKSQADFTWLSECYGDDPITFIADDDGGNINDFTWDFGDGSEPLHKSDSLAEHLFAAPSSYHVKLSVYSIFGCKDSIVKTVPVRPYVYFDQIAGGVYFEDFESGGNGWVSEAEEKHGLNTWELGKPEGSVINQTPDGNGNSIWFTDVNYPDHQAEQSYVKSPCFDFSQMERPMIKLDIWKATDQYRGGSNIQYTTDGGNTWNNIGTTDDGIAWYDYTRIAGEPGGEREGWSVSSPDTTWREARNNLDEIAGQDNIQFRVTYGSDGNEVDPFEGFAFDNVWIGNRTRKVVIEHFTNNNEQQARNIELNNVYPLAQTHQVDLVDVHYHTVFPDPDPLNKDYPAGPNARSAFYGVSGVPFTLMDGNYGKYNYDEGNALSENDLLRRILMDPQFQIDPVVEIVEGLVKTETQITALKDLGNSDISVYTMILEKSVSAENWGGGSNDIYRNVVKTILPDPGGKRYVRSWTSGEKVNLVQAWEIENVYNTDSLMTVVFVQNNTTKEIYQTGIASIGSVDTTIATSIQPMQTEQYTYTVFPNPVSEKVNVLFDKMPPVELTVRIYNNLGELILSQQMHETGLRKILDVHELHEGIYFLQLHSGDQLIGVEKLFIMKN